MCAVVLGVVACTQKQDQGVINLKTPEIVLEGNTVIWDAIDHAEKYEVLVDGEEKETKNPRYTIITDKESVTIKVRALGDGIKTMDSGYSNQVTYTKGNRLDTPIMNEPNIAEGDTFDPIKVVFSWGKVEGATSYEVSVNDKITGSVDTNEYVMNASDLKEVGQYTVKVKAISGDSKSIDSEPSAPATFYKQKMLEFGKEPMDKPHYDGSNIRWSAVTGTGKYRVLVTKVGGEQKELKPTTNTSMGPEEIDKYIEEYNTDADGKLDEAAIAGEYKFSIWPENKDKENVYVAMDAPEPVRDKEGKEEITLKKAPAVTGVNVNASTITWDKAEGDVKYEVVLSSHNLKDNNNNLVYKDIETTSLELKEKEGFKQYYGRVFDVEVRVQADGDKGVLSGVSAKADKKLCIDTDQPTLNGNVYEIDSAADFVYMLEHADTVADYKLTQDIDFGEANVYAPARAFNCNFDGAGHIIKNVKFVAKNGNVELFSSIQSASVFKNVSFVNVQVDSDKDVHLLAGINNGTIEKVYFLKSSISTSAEEASLVGTNAKTISNVGIVQSSISAKSKVAGVAITNNDSIFNPSIVNGSKITISIDKKENKANVNELLAAGVVCQNNGEVSHAVVYDADIHMTYDMEGIITAYMGGIAAKNAGKITTSYIEGGGDTDKVLAIGVGKGEDKQYIGGIAGYMTAGNITNTYAYKLNIDNSGYAGGIVGFVTDGVVSNSFVAIAKVAGYLKENTAMIANGKVDGFKDNYFRSQKKLEEDEDKARNQGGQNLVNAGYASFPDLVSKAKLDGFVLMPNKEGGNKPEVYSEIPVLSDLIYVNVYSVDTALTSAEENKAPEIKVKAWAGGKSLTLDKEHYVSSSNTTSGEKLDFVINGLADGRQVILPIYNRVQ